MSIKEIIEFWFGENHKKTPLQNSKKWFTKDPKFDAEVSALFKPTLQHIAEGGLADWNETPQGSLAYILLTDQFPRNIFRNQKTSFAFDPYALIASKFGVQHGLDEELSWIERTFYYLPFEHAEDIKMQEEALRLFQNLQRSIPKEFADYGDSTYDYAIRHWEIIKKFGRFPHRNLILRRDSTPEEIEFLKQPDSSF